VLLNLEEEAETSIVEEKDYELIPQNFREVFTNIFHLKLVSTMPTKESTNQFIITKLNTSKTTIITSAMGGNQETKTILKFLGSTFNLKQKTGEVS